MTFLNCRVGWIELIEDVDHAALVVTEVVHISDEDAIVRTLGHKPIPFETLNGDVDLITRGKVQVERFSVGERDAMRG